MRTLVFIFSFLLLVVSIVLAIVNAYLDGYEQIKFALFYSTSPITLIWLILVDAKNAFKRKAHWVPRKALVLSAFTIQLLTVINNGSSVSYLMDDSKNQNLSMADFLLKNQMIIDSGSLVICVFIAYLIPGIVDSRSGFTEVWGNIGALMINVLSNTMMNISMATSQGKKTIWFKISNATIFASIVVLLLLLSCSALAGKSIHKILSQKIPIALSCCPNSSEKRDCQKTQDHVLKCWIVVRACQPDYIIARSLLSPLAGLVVTICVVIKLMSFRLHYFNKLDLESKARVVILFVFIVMGWMIVFFRGVTAVLYFPRNQQMPCGESNIVEGLFYTEDFWTRSLRDMRDDHVVENTRTWFSWKKKFNEKPVKKSRRDKRIGDQGKRTPRSGLNWATSATLHVRFCVQKILVLLCKACWFLSEILCKACWFLSEMPLRYKILGRLLNKREETLLSSKFPNYKNTLECIRMPRETASCLWIANVRAFNRAQHHVDIAIEIGKNKCKELKSLIEENTGHVEGEAETLLEEEKCFTYTRQNSWKRKAVSLIYFIIYFYDGDIGEYKFITLVDNVIEAYSQAWDLLDFVDSSNPEAEIVSDSADKDFNFLKNIWQNHIKRKPPSSLSVDEGKLASSLPVDEEIPRSSLSLSVDEEMSPPSLSISVDEGTPRSSLSVDEGKLECKIRKPIDKWMGDLSGPESASSDIVFQNRLHDSRDWMTVAGKFSLFKRWKNIDHNLTKADKMHKNKQMLANIIAHCIKHELPKALIENCNKWALEGKETEIFNAAFIGGKAYGLMAVEARVGISNGGHPSKLPSGNGGGAELDSVPDDSENAGEGHGEGGDAGPESVPDDGGNEGEGHGEGGDAEPDSEDNYTTIVVQGEEIPEEVNDSPDG